MKNTPEGLNSTHLKKVKEDLQNFLDDWKKLENEDINNPEYLNKISKDLISLYEDATKLLSHPKLKEDAELTIYLLTTPWGAPFVGEDTLLDAAKEFKPQEIEKTKLYHLLGDFVTYTAVFENQLFCLSEDFIKDVNQNL